ncbi:MAG: sigma-70 family RNA polymerase sigma factor, partial [Planctomycetes bacterium]|nr:sigma-70 family RNA polymerase sigma factor [Planctomycetota bacterium]
MGASMSIMPPIPKPNAAPPTADEQLVRRHVRGVWRFLRVLGCAPDEADDLTQEAFLVALRKGTGDRGERQVAAFLRQTARHLFLRSRRLRGRRAERHAALVEEVFAAACGDDGGDARVEALRGCVEQLPERSRSLVRMFYGEERSREDVARALGMKETGVKTALQRLRRSLRECLQRSER